MKKNQMYPSAKKSRRFDDPQTTPRRSSRLSASDEFSSKIPIDLIIEIFSRLPLKSIATCRCVSKRWASALRRSDFTELFLAKSLARPQLLFSCSKEKEVTFFSSPQPQNLEEDSSPIVTVNHHVSFPVESACHVSSPLSGVVCISDERFLKGRKTSEIVWVICNPSTRRSLTLPKMKARKRTGMRSFLGYDPVEKQHKVLAMIWQKNGAEMHQVLTLGDGRLTWRMVECGFPHSLPERCVCINGVLYYIARVSKLIDMLVCFDVKSEKYSFVTLMDSGLYDAILINFQGKLASVRESTASFFSGTSTSLEMCILEDPEKHEWSKRIFSLPPMGTNAAASREVLYLVGVTDTNEFVFKPFCSSSSEPFYVYYYNFVKDAITRVEIQGIGAFDKTFIIRMFLNHVEDVKLME